MLALLACVSFASCTTGGGEEVQYVKIGQNLCSFLAEGNQPLEIDVKASPAEWTVEAGATWVKAERTADRTLTVTVEDNDTGSERSAVLTVTAGQAVQEIGIRQLAADGAFARFRKSSIRLLRGCDVSQRQVCRRICYLHCARRLLPILSDHCGFGDRGDISVRTLCGIDSLFDADDGRYRPGFAVHQRRYERRPDSHRPQRRHLHTGGACGFSVPA